MGYAAACEAVGGAEALSKKGRAAALEKYGEDGLLALAKKGRAVAVEKYGEEGMRELSRKGHARAAAAAGGAANLARKARAAAAQNHPWGEVGFAMHSGTVAARKAGKYVKYAGVRWRKDTNKWRVQFGYLGEKYSVGSYATELEAAHAHDRFVAERGFKRPLHFPDGVFDEHEHTP